MRQSLGSLLSLTALFVVVLIFMSVTMISADIKQPSDAALVPSPSYIGFPTFGHPSTQKDFSLILKNTGDTPLSFTSVSKFADSCQGPGCGPTAWLNITGVPGSIAAGDSAIATLNLNWAGVVTAGPTRLWGRVVFDFDSPSQSVTLPISYTVADTIQPTFFDTLTTGANIKLVVGNNGDLGNNGAGGVNMNYNPPVECDTGANSRGNAAIYLRDASPVVVRKVGANPARLSYSMYNNSYISPYGFKPLAIKTPAFTDTATYQSYYCGQFMTTDSLVRIQRWIYAPKPADSAQFMIEKTQFMPNPIGTPVTNLVIGEAYDWDVPSDSGGGIADSSGFVAAKRLVWVSGFNSADATLDCANNSYRYAGAALLSMHTKATNSCVGIRDTLIYGAYSAANDSFVYPAAGFTAEQTWSNMSYPGYVIEPRITDIHTTLTFKGGQTGFTLPANDTLTVYTAIVVNRTSTSASTGLDSLKRTLDKARKWVDYHIRGCICCSCLGNHGDVNWNGSINLGDVSALVNYLTGGGFVPPSMDAADVNASGVVNLADLSSLVSYLTGGGFQLIPCH